MVVASIFFFWVTLLFFVRFFAFFPFSLPLDRISTRMLSFPCRISFYTPLAIHWAGVWQLTHLAPFSINGNLGRALETGCWSRRLVAENGNIHFCQKRRCIFLSFLESIAGSGLTAPFFCLVSFTLIFPSLFYVILHYLFWVHFAPLPLFAQTAPSISQPIHLLWIDLQHVHTAPAVQRDVSNASLYHYIFSHANELRAFQWSHAKQSRRKKVSLIPQNKG